MLFPPLAHKERARIARKTGSMARTRPASAASGREDADGSWWSRAHALSDHLADRSRREGPRPVLYAVDVMIDRFKRHVYSLGSGCALADGRVVEQSLALAADGGALAQPRLAALARELETLAALGRGVRARALVAELHAEARRILSWLRTWRALNTLPAPYVRFTVG